MTSSTLSLTRQTLLAALLATAGGIAVAATPAEQQAIVQTGTGGPDVLKLQTVPVAEPGEGQVLVRVYAASVNPTDWKMRAGTPGYPAAGTLAIPGGDVAGVIEKLGAGVTGLKVGQSVTAVIVRSAKPLNGGYSQFVLAKVDNVFPKPASMSYAQAAGLGVASVTGVRVVSDVRLEKGERVLITGVAGGVGSAAAQAAKARGAYVIGTASASHNAYLKTLGVDEVIDYTQVKFEEKVSNVVAVIDTVGSDTAERALGLLKQGGRFVSVAARDLDAKCAAAGVTCAGRTSAPDVQRSIYDETSRLAASGKLNVKIDKTYPLAQAGQAQAYGEQGHTEGKIVLIVDAAKANTK